MPPTRPPLSIISRFPPWLAVLIGVALLAPSAWMGFYVDDYVHQLALLDANGSVPMQPWSLYDFGSKADWAALNNRVGSFPWWTDDAWRIRFLRPLSSLVLWSEYRIFGGWAAGYHLFGLALFAFLVLQVHGLFRALGLAPETARAGTLLFAICDSAVLPAGWPANLNTLLVALLSVIALRAVVGSAAPRAGRIALALSAAGAAALAKESGAVAFVLVAGTLLFHRHVTADSTERARLALGAGLAGLLLIVHTAWFVAGGYGTQSLFYATPWQEPLRFGGNLAMLFAGAPLSLSGPFPLDVGTIVPAAALPAALFGAALGIPLSVWIARTVSGARGAGTLMIWTVLFIIPQAGGPPADRLMFVPAVGAAGLLALFFEARSRAASDSGGWARIASGAVLAASTLGSAGFLFIQASGLTVGSNYLRETALATEVGSPDVGHRDLYVLQAESQIQAFSLHSTWSYETNDDDLTFWNLQLGRRALRWTRAGPNSFELESLGEPFLTGLFERVYLVGPPRFEVGHRWQSDQFVVEALAVDLCGPTRLRFELAHDLEATNVSFLRPIEGTLHPIAPPAIGESIELPAPERGGPYMP